MTHHSKQHPVNNIESDIRRQKRVAKRKATILVFKRGDNRAVESSFAVETTHGKIKAAKLNHR